MIRLCSQIGEKVQGGLVIAKEPVLLDEDVWGACREAFIGNGMYGPSEVLYAVPLVGDDGERAGYAYQDYESNRELRMLGELLDNPEALQFGDVCPEYREAAICGCNELAFRLAEYLEAQGIPVEVTGRYWDCFGYPTCGYGDWDGGSTLVITAEPVPDDGGMAGSVSSEFECIDKVYEANVLSGRIKDTAVDWGTLQGELRGRDGIFILGTGNEAQDGYDLLMENGIDISGFVDMGANNGSADGSGRRLLGKGILGLSEAIRIRDAAFIDCMGRNSALGTEYVEILDYCGFRRNEQFFMLRDYAGITCSNLIHVLKGKKVFLAGDKRLCTILAKYLEKAENNEIEVRYTDLREKIIEPDAVQCCVFPTQCYGRLYDEGVREWWEKFNRKCAWAGYTDYTAYFCQAKTFLLADLSQNGDEGKYTISSLTPKGIVLGGIEYLSGSYFISDIMDGHPQILMLPHSHLRNALFYFCICLSDTAPENMLGFFWDLYYDMPTDEKPQSYFWEKYGFHGTSVGNIGQGDFPDKDRFERSMRRLLSGKARYTSQELFVIFHIAYNEMMGRGDVDISQSVIFWEPHQLPRQDFYYLEQWLESGGVLGRTMIMRRNHVVRFGSRCHKVLGKGWGGNSKSLLGELFYDGSDNPYQEKPLHWERFTVRFEDVKLNPEEELMGICRKIGIPWSETMLETTVNGEAASYAGISGFDIKPVFNLYEEYLSEFDRFRVSIASGPFQKKYGYVYENCTEFPRKSLYRMFNVRFRFQEDGEEAANYSLTRWDLWEARKKMLLDGLAHEGEGAQQKRCAMADGAEQAELDRTMEFLNGQGHLVLYGTGMCCKALLKFIDGSKAKGLIYCDRNAEKGDYYFHGQKVVAPESLLSTYSDYKILVTSPVWKDQIRQYFEEIGIDPGRVFYNSVPLDRY